MLKELKVQDFLEVLSSDAPAPGGGSTAAFAASTAASLTCMVFNLTIGKKMYEEYNDSIKTEIKSSLDKAKSSIEVFADFMDKDAEAFNDVIAAFKLPKETEEQKSKRLDAIQNGYLVALEVPLELAEKAYSLYECIDVAAAYGNKNAISDAGVASLMLQAAIESAVLNVKINLASIKDEVFKEKVTQHCTYIVDTGVKRKEEILRVCNSKI